MGCEVARARGAAKAQGAATAAEAMGVAAAGAEEALATGVGLLVAVTVCCTSWHQAAAQCC